MKIKIVLLSALILFLQTPLFAESATIKQKVIGKTIKTVARLAVATTNIEKVKKRLINKLGLMKDEQFRARYAKFYDLIKDMPQDIKASYKVTPYMTKEEMRGNIESMDKKKAYKIINSISDKTVAELFKRYRREMRDAS